MPPVTQTLPVWFQLLLLLIPSISAGIAVFALALNFFQARRQTRLSRSSLVAECLNGFLKDEEVQAAFYDVEYGRFSYGTDFHGSETERRIDKLLMHFANLALAWKGGLLKIEDIAPVRYHLLRILENQGVQKYLAFLKGWAESNGVEEHPYKSLEQLRLAMIDEGGGRN